MLDPEGNTVQTEIHIGWKWVLKWVPRRQGLSFQYCSTSQAAVHGLVPRHPPTACTGLAPTYGLRKKP